MIWEFVFTGNDLFIEQPKRPLLLERLEPKKRKYHWYPLKTTYLGHTPTDDDPLHPWRIAKKLNSGVHHRSHSIVALLLSCRAM